MRISFRGGHSIIPALIRSLAAGATTFSKAVAASIPVTASSKSLTGDPAGTRRAMSPSPAAVTVTVNDPTTGVFTAKGGDAQGDHLFSIENSCRLSI